MDNPPCCAFAPSSEGFFFCATNFCQKVLTRKILKITLKALKNSTIAMRTLEYNLTDHAIARWEERFGLPLSEMLARLEAAKPIGRGFRRYLIETTKSERHAERLNLHNCTGFFYRQSIEVVFVISNLDVVTVFKAPERFVRYTK